MPLFCRCSASDVREWRGVYGTGWSVLPAEGRHSFAHTCDHAYTTHHMLKPHSIETGATTRYPLPPEDALVDTLFKKCTTKLAAEQISHQPPSSTRTPPVQLLLPSGRVVPDASLPDTTKWPLGHCILRLFLFHQALLDIYFLPCRTWSTTFPGSGGPSKLRFPRKNCSNSRRAESSGWPR